MQFTMVGLLVAVVTRSLLAALFVPIVVAAAQVFSPQTLALMRIAPDDWAAVLVNPGAASAICRRWSPAVTRRRPCRTRRC